MVIYIFIYIELAEVDVTIKRRCPYFEILRCFPIAEKSLKEAHSLGVFVVVVFFPRCDSSRGFARAHLSQTQSISAEILFKLGFSK